MAAPRWPALKHSRHGKTVIDYIFKDYFIGNLAVQSRTYPYRLLPALIGATGVTILRGAGHGLYKPTRM